MDKLSVKQERFCEAYVETGNASEAYRRAYRCEGMKPASINRKAVELFENGKITARIKVLQNELKEKSDLSRERILEELECILDAKITDYVELEDGSLKFKDFGDLSERQVKAIESVKQGRNGIELRLHGKSWTIERICKMLGYDAPERVENTISMSRPLTLEERERIRQELEDEY